MILYILSLSLLLGSTLVFYSLSPYYAAVGLVISSFFGCILLGVFGLSFIALLLLLIYMGGMLVVFIYSSALSADRYPEVSNMSEVFILFFLISIWIFIIFEEQSEGLIHFLGFSPHYDLNGLSELYGFGSFYLIVGGIALLVVLVVALIISRGINSSSLRHL